MAKKFLQLYLTLRNPRNFLWLLCGYIASSLVFHCTMGYDSDFGLTNLIMSIEASTAGAVLMMVAEESARVTAEMLRLVVQMVKELRQISDAQERTLKGVMLMVEAQRDTLIDQKKLLQALKESDERILKVLTQRENQ
jgi:hypothetical protein